MGCRGLQTMRFIQPINDLHTHTHTQTGLEEAGLSACYSTYGQVHNSKAQFYIFYFSLSFSCQLNLLSSLPFQLSQSCLSSSPLTLSPLTLYPSLFPLDVSEPPFFLLLSFFFSHCFTSLSTSFRLIAACSVRKRKVFHLRNAAMQTPVSIVLTSTITYHGLSVRERTQIPDMTLN